MKRDRKKITSSVRNATQISNETGKPKIGLLKFFSKGTPADTKAYWDREEERVAVIQSSNDYNAKNLDMEKKVHERDLARVRQQKRRKLKKNGEIHDGTRSPRGTKRKVQQFLKRKYNITHQ
jgi:hypothetical protein